MNKLRTHLKMVWAVCLLASIALAEDPGDLYRNTIPEDKQLDAAWVQSLTERGHPLDRGISGTKKDDTLKYIGMPVGGIGCGTVYLSGDGRLYVWDIWSRGSAGVVPNSIEAPEGYEGRVQPWHGSSYLNPPSFDAFAPDFSQGFGLRLKDGSVQPFNAEAWESVEFTGKWPLGTVSYQDSKSPIHAELNAYSPFISLDLEDSTIPVTVLTYRLSNVSDKTVSAELVGWLENMSMRADVDQAGTFQHQSQFSSLSHHCEMELAAGRGKNMEQPASVYKGTMALSYLGDGQQTVVEQVPGIAADVVLKPGESRVFTFLISWDFPLVRIQDDLKKPLFAVENEYASRFEDATAVAEYSSKHFEMLSSQTLLWVDTWNDSTLPQWLLDRTIVTADTLQTANCWPMATAGASGLGKASGPVSALARMSGTTLKGWRACSRRWSAIFVRRLTSV